MAVIAIVDDSRLARSFVAASLKQTGHEVAEIEPVSLGQVLESLRDLRPELLVLDQQMPTFSGSSLVRACFEDDLLSTVKVMMLTAHRNEDLEHRMEKLGVHAVLHKPISPVDLNTAVAALIGEAGSES
ncbi:MAG: response regulator [Geothrix sp.]|uniref:response regulator n=1 Tax=Geothrix sp. TaxID=1962974 RepID=UPI0018210338|nr:response regulator [Geothrix sp.]NWJ39926.1 response regulator [Geothrix sp.]WIL22062.1 MAG: response regulator [Geothrix sp.]